MLSEFIDGLPIHLAERTRDFRIPDGIGATRIEERERDPQIESGGFVLYWMRTAVRSDENPALDVAVACAAKLKVSLLVYHSISQNYRYASDRHHTFMLEAARDVQATFAAEGVDYAFHLATPDDDQPHLVTLAGRAAIVVTEDMPVDPPRAFLNALARQIDSPIACVDTACVVPMKMVGKAHTRAFAYRDATKSWYADRVAFQWPRVSRNDLDLPRFDFETLPFRKLDLQTASISDLVANCEIDHAVGPVRDTVGGSTAGYARWNQFKSNGLAAYAKRRNNALIDGVSRMSAYLHYGMVSPFRIAREAALEANANAGAEKFLDELLVWRELAYAFCFYRHDHDQWTAIPEWAQDTLLEHAGDKRPQTYGWETLARGATKDAFWNAAQKSLLVNGELHNNVRMTWGKAMLDWIDCPQEALRLMIDLNHRYALDGRDPSSYGGLLWCLGQFDRPFKPEQEIVGTVRPRSTAEHAKRLDVEKWQAKVTTPRWSSVPKVAVIGAGMSGLFAARTLVDHGCEVRVFEKGRGCGGRMSTRRVNDHPTFDHGAQYFTVRDRRFRRYVDSWIAQGLVAAWPDVEGLDRQKIAVLDGGKVNFKEDDSVTRYVGTPGMNAIAKHLASGIDVVTQANVAQVEKADGRIRLLDSEGSSFGDFDRLVVSAPAAQAAKLLANFPLLAEPISQIKMNPCWSAMVRFDETITEDWVGAFVHNSLLSWVARNGTKPGRPVGEHLVLHAGPEWTAENWERPASEVAADMLAAFWESSGIEPRVANHLVGHRWKFAIPVDVADKRCFFDEATGIVACGDWALGPRIEGAFLSGMAAAGRMLGSLV